jgi:hypothetical protein
MLNALLDWIETGERQSRAQARKALGDTLDWAFREGVVTEAGLLKHTLCPACWNGHRAKVEAKGKGWCLYCEDEGFIALSADEVAALAVSPKGLGEAIARSLGWEAEPMEREAARLWQLGDLEIDGVSRTIFFARKTESARDIDDIVEALNRRGSQLTGIVLTAGFAPLALRSRSRHRFAPLIEMATLETSGLVTSRDTFAALLTDARRPRHHKSGESKAELRAAWLRAANDAWEQLDAQKMLTKDAKAMGVEVESKLHAIRPKLKFVPKPKVITEALLERHRKAYTR